MELFRSDAEGQRVDTLRKSHLLYCCAYVLLNIQEAPLDIAMSNKHGNGTAVISLLVSKLDIRHRRPSLNIVSEILPATAAAAAFAAGTAALNY